MKKSIKLLLCTLAVLLAVPLAMCAAEKLGGDRFSLAPKADAATIVDSGECGAWGDNVTWTLDSDGLLTISGTGKMYDYPWNVKGRPWENSDVISVVISEGVTNIGDYAFYNCTGLTSITIPGSVTSIGERTFFDCTGLTSVTIPDGVTSIGDSAFWGCTGLTNITIPDSVTIIGDYAFYECTGLTSITIPDSVTSIGGGAFYDCTGLTSIAIPDGVTSIGNDAFSGCSSLTSITIPNSVKSIGYSAFYMVLNIVYSGTASGSPWRARALNGYIEDGLVYEDSSKTKLLACPSSREGTVVIPNSVTSIGEDAFFYCTGLTNITIPDSVTSIGDWAFYECSSLTSITIPSGVTSIDEHAFCGCSSLTSITIPDSVTSIGESAFSGCTGLTSITIPDSVTSIGESAFYMVPNIVYSGAASGSPWGARALNGFIEDGLVYENSSKTKLLACPSSREGTVVIPNSVTSIGDNAFYECSSLASVTIPDSVTSIGYYAFRDCSSLTSITIPGGVTSIGSHAFYECSSLKKVYAAGLDSWLKIKFSGWGSNPCNNGADLYFNGEIVKEVAVPNNVTSIGDYAFSGCTGLTSITIPDGVTSIGDYAFSGCTGLTSITIPDGVTSIGNGAFNKCSSLTSVTIPDSVTSIGEGAFYDCTGLTSITIPNSVSSIDVCAFEGCSSLTSIAIPDGVTRIGSFAFSGCTGLTRITIPSGVTSIDERAFCGCSSLTSITILGSVTSIGWEAFNECSRLNDVFILNPDSLTEESAESIFPSAATIHSHSGYGVERYAKEHRYNFVSLCTWDNGTVTREPQVGVAGERTYTCTVCGATRTEGISPLVPSVPERIEVKSSDSAKELTGGIVGATHSVTVSELLASSNASYIVDKDGNRVTDKKPLATGMKIILESGGERLEKVISVLGDVNGDGEISVSDARGALRAAVGLDTLEGAYLNAAKVNGANEVAVNDARSILRAAVALDTGKDWLANIK